MIGRYGLPGRLGLLLVLALFTFSAGLQAQTISGVIVGSVKDQQGNAVPGATVNVIDSKTNRTFNTSSDENGQFRIPEIRPGVYTVQVINAGYQTVERKEVLVLVGKTATENIVLQVAGPDPKVIQVQASESTPVDTTGPTMSTSLVERQVQELPILTRDINNLALLAPGVLSVRSFSFSSTLVPFSVNGSRGRDNNFIIDSVDNNEPLFGGAATQFTNTDIFTEYTILTNQLKAEFGRSSGATVNVITKAGSNRHSGTLFWYGQFDALNSLNQVERSALLTEPSVYREQQIGGTLGGPLKKDKAFYFVSYQNDSATTNLSNVYPVVATYPTPAGLAALGSLPQSPALLALRNVPSLQTVPTLTAPCFETLPPPAQAPGFNLNNPCRAPVSVPVGTANIPFATYLVPDANAFDVHDTQISGRFDYQLTRSQDVYFRYLFDDLSTPRIPLSPAGEAAFSDLGLYPDYRVITRQRTQSFLANHRYYWVKSLNEFRFSFSRISQGIGPYKIPEAARENNAAASVFDNFGGFGVFQTTFSAAGQRFTIGRDTSPSQANSNIFQFQDNFSMIRGKHNIKFGVNYVRTRSNIKNIPGDLGLYDFEPFFFSTGLAGFAAEGSSGNTGAIITFQRLANVQRDPASLVVTGLGDPTLKLRGFDQFYFVQDDWRVSNTLTLSLGLRYEYFNQPLNGVHKSNNQVPTMDLDRNNFAPRVGFAWAWRNKTVFRGGYSMLYNPVVLNIPLLVWQSGPISPQVVSFQLSLPGNPVPIFSTVLTPSGTYPQKPFSASDLNAARVAGCSRVFDQFPTLPTLQTVSIVDCGSQDTVRSDLRNPYIQNWTLGVQQGLWEGFLLEVSYVGSKGTKLFQRSDNNPFLGWDVNGVGFDQFGFQNCPFFSPSSVFCQLPRRNDRRGSITTISNDGASSYSALQASISRRSGSIGAAGSLAFTMSYTWSHNIDNASEIFGPGVRFLRNPSVNSNSFIPFITDPLVQGFNSLEAITPLPQDSGNLRAERGNSSFDRRHRFVMSYLWQIGRSDNFFLGGWKFSGIVAYQSGQSFSPLNGSPFGLCPDANGDGRITNDRPAIGNPDAPAGSVALINRGVNPTCDVNNLGFANDYVDRTGAVINPANARYVQVPLGVLPGVGFTSNGHTFIAGSAGRNTLQGPNLINWDMSILKDFSFGERMRLQFRWEVYNVLNRSNPGNAIGNAFATDAQPTPGFAFSSRFTAAGVTGVIPENAIDASNPTASTCGPAGGNIFLSRCNMNTSSRRMQFGLKLIF